MLSVDVNYATSKGDNYMSDMYRVNVEYSQGIKSIKKISVLVKVAPVTEGFQKEAVRIFVFNCNPYFSLIAHCR